MKKFLYLSLVLTCSACAQYPYHLKIDNGLSEVHGQSIYFRSNMRSAYAGQIRRVLSKKFGESGIRTATSADDADYIAVFDIETFYKQSGSYKNNSYQNVSETPLFSANQDDSALSYSGNADMKVANDSTCFTLKIGPKETSDVRYSSTFCASDIFETEQMLPLVLDIYGKYGNYQSADVGVQCVTAIDNTVSCNVVHDRQQAFINSLWIEHDIVDDYDNYEYSEY